MKLIILLLTTIAFITEPMKASHLRKYHSNINQQISISEKKRDLNIDVVIVYFYQIDKRKNQHLHPPAS